MTTKSTPGQPDMAETAESSTLRRIHTVTNPPHRVFFRDIKPYELPESLDDLEGPLGGVITLPRSVLWAPGDGRIDLDVQGGMALAYRAVLAEGTVADQVTILNRDRLIAIWQHLLLPLRVRDLWERRFLELRVETRSAGQADSLMTSC